MENSNKKGGKDLKCSVKTSLIRSIGKYMISQVGSQLLSGKMSLTGIRFPITCNAQKTALQLCHASSSLFSFYMNMGVISNCALTRFNNVLVSIIGALGHASMFIKPLNPILGETFQSSYYDGIKIYSEQISHHPPINYFLTVGTNNSYHYYGYYLNDANAGFNSLKVFSIFLFIFLDYQ